MEATMELSVFERTVPVLRNAGQILQSNTVRKDKALEVGRSILTAIQEEGMTPDLDARAMNYLANVTKALGEMKEGRAEVTQIMDELKKLYTQVENEMDSKKGGTIPAQVQAHRDAFARQQAEERKRKQEEADRAAAKAQERINLVYTCENRLSNYYNDHLLETKKKLQTAFNAITLDNFSEKEQALRRYAPAYSADHFAAFQHGLYSSTHSREELAAIAEEVASKNGGRYQEFSANFLAEITLFVQELIDKLPSKKAEIEEARHLAEEAERKRKEELERQRKAEEARQAALAQAKAEEKKALEEKAAREREEERLRLEALQKENEEKAARAKAEQDLREEQERLKMEQEAEEAKRKAEQEAAIEKEGASTMVLFDKEAALADAAPAPEARQGYDITVLHQAGYVQIFQFWFENEGKGLPLDKMEKTSLGQMKAFCEKKAHKDGTKIESKFIRYDESFKAINKKK